MGDGDEVAAILDLITATQIQLHAMALVLEETGVKNVDSRLDAIRNRLHREKFQATRAAIQNNFEQYLLEHHKSPSGPSNPNEWTTDRPTKPGRYWCQMPDIRPHVVELVLEPDSHRLTIAQSGTYVDVFARKSIQISQRAELMIGIRQKREIEEYRLDL